jgi:signal transduction histidine kinase/ActR/RegA family two-component response regulator
MPTINRQRFAEPFMWMTAIAGVMTCLFSVYHLPFAQLDTRFLLIGLVTAVIGSRIGVKIPHTTSEITVSDTFVFLALLLFGGEAAILLAAVEAFCASWRFSRRPLTIMFNAGQMACATTLTIWTLHICFGSIADLAKNGFSPALIAALCVMALVQYAANSFAIAIRVALKANDSIWHTWRKNYLWSSITYFVGAFAAGIIANMVGSLGFYAFLITTPIIAIIYFTYRTYLKNVEAAAQHAAQAERHVEELSRYIAEQERIREQFSQIEKLSALGELASGVAHDFNNTLAGILGRAQLMLRTNDPEKIKRGLNIIIQSAEDGAKTVKRIQDFARQRRDHDFAPVAVDQLLLDVGEITRPRWKDRAEVSNVHINLSLNVNSRALVMGDASELREVLINMVFNAVDAMPKGGTLTLAANEIDNSVEISISDTGVGMSQEVRSRIFDPFFTTKGQAGLGLGLAVSYGIIRRHEGNVEVQSEPERGTTFRITLPIAQGITAKAFSKMMAEEAAAISATNGVSSSMEAARVKSIPRALRLKILVVDDEEKVRDLLRDTLESEECEVATASSGHEALQCFEQTTFDAIFTDIGMPEMSGWEFAYAVRERNPSIPIAVITGWGEAVGSIEQKAAQIDWIVTKPFSATRISELVTEIAQRKSGELSGELSSAERMELTVAA